MNGKLFTKTNKMTKLTLFSFPLLILLSACANDGPIYYKITGEGYAFDKTTKMPLSYDCVAVDNYPDMTGFGSQPRLEIYPTDENGFYQVRFIKRYDHRGSIYKGSKIFVNGMGSGNSVYFDKEFLQKQKKTFKIDTLWQENINY
jgi:hypothetical protein